MSELYVGGFYVHPEDGLIQVTGGSVWVNRRLSNYFYWRVLLTGEIHNGYGGEWPEFTGVETVTHYEINRGQYGPEVRSTS